jgi:ATP-dependent Clp protease ATP-binding subunit ClpB
MRIRRSVIFPPGPVRRTFFFALEAASRGSLRAAFLWLAAQAAIDSSDGALARLVGVKAVLPDIDGNRLDDIVVFSPLSKEDLGSIVELYIDRLQVRLAERRLELAVTPAARLWLGERGYDPIYGARPLRRLMQHEIDDKLATGLLSGTIRDGERVRVDVNNDALTVESMKE